MDRIFAWKDADSKDLPPAYAGVAVWFLPGGALHVGVLYRTPQQQPWILHLRGHYGGAKEPKFQNTAPEPDALCVLCPLDPTVVPSIARVFRDIHRENKNPGLPYGLSLPVGEWFDENRRFSDSSPGRGLCCHTFVIAAYRAADTQLLEPETPVPRDDDADWQYQLLAGFESDLKKAERKTQAHFEIIRAAIPFAIYRPLEVAGAALADELPCPIDLAIKYAEELRRSLFPENAALARSLPEPA